ncbi:hypothetical protein [Streptomyces sp. NPDC093261]|uniref:hypothetical protein n=1 Tax=Streptomyces sp. NPDC093261 TaxID=3366037 RepID=UPI0037F99CE1
MIRTSRLAMIAPLVVSSLAFGPAVAAHAATGQAPTTVPAKARCLLTEDAKSTSDNPTFTLVGSGFEPGFVSFSGSKAGGGVKTTTGTFSIGGLPAGHYTASSSTNGKVNCGSTPKSKGSKDAEAQYKKGFRDGFTTIKKNCSGKMPQGIAGVDPNYEKGFKDGAALAAKQFCSEE